MSADLHQKKINIHDQSDNFLKLMENIKTASPHTLKAYRLDIRQAFENVEISEKNSPASATALWLDETELLTRARQAQMKWGSLSAASRNRKAATLKSFFGYLFKEGLINQDLALQIHSPKITKKIPHFLSVDDVIAVLKSFDSQKNQSEKNTEQIRKEKILFLLLYGGGLRISEACHLKWKQCQFEKQIIYVLGKGNKERIVALPKTLCVQLIAYKKDHPELISDNFIWGQTPLNPRIGYDWIRKIGINANLLHAIHPHALRHSFATHLLSSGANLRTLQELLGHESLRATEKYTHLNIHQLANTLEKHHPLNKK